MKIFFDGKIFSAQKFGGISRVAFEFSKQLRFKDVSQFFYRGFCIDSYPIDRKWYRKYWGLKTPDSITGRVINYLDNLFLNYFYNNNADNKTIFYSSYYRIPKKIKGPVVVHCYDLIHELFGSNQKVINFKRKSFESANLIIAISQSAKNDLCRIYPQINPKKVSVVHLGVSDVFFEENIVKSFSRPYMLYVGARNYDYKNFDFFLDNFISKKYFLNYDLVLFGGEKTLTQSQIEKIRKSDDVGKWILKKYGDDQDLAKIYAEAKVFVYPSLYEGFGIPPLEAMACGCPVLASNTSSIPEVVGDAGLMFNPKDKSDFLEKLEIILNDKKTSFDLVQRGRVRAREFTWRKMADNIFEELLKLE